MHLRLRQTGSGKTYTMEGGAGETEGVIPRTLRQLTDEMAARPQTAFTTHIRMIEIYNEKIFDLLGNNLPWRRVWTRRAACSCPRLAASRCRTSRR